MTAITFDTLKFTRKLRDSGIPENQAEAIAAAFKEAQGEAELATKADLRELKTELMGEMKLLRWIMGATFGGVIFILLRLLMPAAH